MAWVIKSKGQGMNYDFPKPFGYWWKLYTDKVSGDTHFFDFEQLFFAPCHGFMTWSLSPDGKVLTIHKAAGDGKYWKQKAYDMFKLGKEKYGLKKLRVCTLSNPEPFARRFCGTVYEEYDRNGQKVYCLETTEVKE